MIRSFLVVAVVLVGARHAYAGVACMSDSELTDAIEGLEKRVTDPKHDLDYLRICLPRTVEGEHATPKRVARVNAACTRILTRDPADQVCVMLAAQQKKAELAGVKIYEAVVAWNSGPWSGPRLLGDWSSDMFSLDLDAFLSLGDPRAAALVVERWTAFQPQADAKEKSKKRTQADMPAWSRWRQQAAGLLGALGSTADVPFLEKQAAATKDKVVKRACTNAIAAIKKREATKP